MAIITPTFNYWFDAVDGSDSVVSFFKHAASDAVFLVSENKPYEQISGFRMAEQRQSNNVFVPAGKKLWVKVYSDNQVIETIPNGGGSLSPSESVDVRKIDGVIPDSGTIIPSGQGFTYKGKNYTNDTGTDNTMPSLEGETALVLSNIAAAGFTESVFSSAQIESIISQMLANGTHTGIEVEVVGNAINLTALNADGVEDVFSFALDEKDIFEVTRINPEWIKSGFWQSTFPNSDYPLIVSEERGTGSYAASEIGEQALDKYRRVLVKESDKAEKAARQAANPNIMLGMYFVADSLVSCFASPFANNGTGSKYTHGPYMDKFGTFTDGGDLSDISNNANQVWPGHYIASDIQVTANGAGALADATDTKTFTIANSDSFIVGHSAMIWTPISAGADWATETATPTNSFNDCEAVYIVSKTPTSVTVRQLTLPSGQQWGTLAAGGGSVGHLAGSHIMPIISSQGSQKSLNHAVHLHQTFCPVDANGNRWVDVLLNFFNDGALYDHNGNAAPNIRYDFVEVDVSESVPSHEVPIDYNGDGSLDGGIIGNKNEFEQAWIDLPVLAQIKPNMVGLPWITGGTNEHDRPNWEGYQHETMLSNEQEGNGDAAEFLNLQAQLYRMRLLVERYKVAPELCSVVYKRGTLAYPKGTTATNNNSIWTVFASATLAGIPFAYQNYASTTPHDQIDAWMAFSSVSDGGIAEANTSDNQDQVIANLGWLGEKVGGIKNASGVTLENPVSVFDFEDAATSTNLGYIAAGSNQGNLALTHDAANGRLVCSGYNASSTFGAARADSPNDAIPANTPVGHDAVVRIKLSANCRGVVSVAFGADSPRVWRIYVDDEPRWYTLSKTLTAADLSSGYSRRIRTSLGRCNYPTTSTPELYIHSAEVFTGIGIDNSVSLQEFENGLSIVNGKESSFTLNIPEGVVYRAIDTSEFDDEDHQVSYVTDGQRFDSNTPFVLPPMSGYVLQKVA